MTGEVKGMEYRLYCNDTRVASFDFDRGIVFSFRPERQNLLPKQLQNASAEMFTLWLQERAIDLNTFVHRELMMKLLGSRDRVAVSIATHMYSVTDTFTCFPEDEFVSRSQLWSRDTQEAVSNFVLVSSDTSLRLRTGITPNASTDGSFTKTWKHENGEWWLYKIQSTEAANSEHAISQALLDCGWDAAVYARVRGKKALIKSKNFVGAGEFFEPYESLRFMFEDKSDDGPVIYENIKSLGSGFEHAYYRILLADALFMNSDRHMRNFGVIRSAATGDILRLAPNFDNNQAYKASRGITYRPVMLRHFFEEYDTVQPKREDLCKLYEACGKIPYLHEAYEAAQPFLP